MACLYPLWFFPCLCWVYWWAHQRLSSFVTVLLICRVSFWLFIIVSISLFTLPIYSCMLSTFSITAPNILIISIFNSPSNDFKIYVISESGFNASFFLFRLCFILPFSVPRKILLKAGHDALDIRTETKVFSAKFYANLCKRSVFSVTVGIRGFRFTSCLCFCLSYCLWTP